MSIMHNAVVVRGRFDGKRVELLEEPPVEGPCEVTIEFSLSEAERRRILDRVRGSWQDSRTTDEIIEDIVGSRTYGREAPG